MDINKLKTRMDIYYDSTTPEQVISDLEKLGVKFRDLKWYETMWNNIVEWLENLFSSKPSVKSSNKMKHHIDGLDPDDWDERPENICKLHGYGKPCPLCK